MRASVLPLLVGALLVASCGRSVNGGNGGNTTWLTSCDADADCGQVGACVRRVCTLPCSANDECAALDPAAACVVDACVVPAAPPTTAIPEERSWIAAFESGYGDDEELWLLPESGDPVRVIGPEGKPVSTVFGSSTYGYDEVGGRIGNVVLDAETQRLFVGLQFQSGYEVRALHLPSGNWSTIGSSAWRPLIVRAELGLVIVLPGPDSLKIFSQVDGRLEVALDGPGYPYAINDERTIHRYALGGGERVYIPGVVHVERTDQDYEEVVFPPGVPTGIDWFRGSPLGTHACAKGDDDTAWLLSNAGALELDLPSPLGGCQFAKQGELLLFSSGYAGQSTSSVFDLQGTLQVSFENFVIQAAESTRGYGSVGPDVVSVDWGTLALEAVLDLPDGPPDSFNTSNSLWSLGDALLVEQHSGCIDCHASSLVLLSVADGSVTAVLDGHEWTFMQVAVLADGTALISRSSEAELVPDRLLRVDSLGNLNDVGPFPNLVTDLHAPVAL